MSDMDENQIIQILMNWRDEKVDRLRKELAASQQANAELRRELGEAKAQIGDLQSALGDCYDSTASR